jgi:hypothetical protein
MECARLRAALDLAGRSRSTHSAAYADPSPHLTDRPNPYDLLSRNWPFLLALTFYVARIAVRNLRQSKVTKSRNDVLEIAWHFRVLFKILFSGRPGLAIQVEVSA